MSAEPTRLGALRFRSTERTTPATVPQQDFDTRAGNEVGSKLRGGRLLLPEGCWSAASGREGVVSVVATSYCSRVDAAVEETGETSGKPGRSASVGDGRELESRSRPSQRPGCRPYTFIAAVALTMKVREGGRVVTRPRVTRRGEREGAPRDHRRRRHLREDSSGWLAVCRDPPPAAVRGCPGHHRRPHGLVAALGGHLPGVSWPRCRPTSGEPEVRHPKAHGRVRGHAALGLRPADAAAVRPVQPDSRRMAQTSHRAGTLEQARADILSLHASPRRGGANLEQQSQRTPKREIRRRPTWWNIPHRDASSLVGRCSAEQHDEWTRGRRTAASTCSASPLTKIKQRRHEINTTHPRRQHTPVPDSLNCDNGYKVTDSYTTILGRPLWDVDVWANIGVAEAKVGQLVYQHGARCCPSSMCCNFERGSRLGAGDLRRHGGRSGALGDELKALCLAQSEQGTLRPRTGGADVSDRGRAASCFRWAASGAGGPGVESY